MEVKVSRIVHVQLSADGMLGKDYQCITVGKTYLGLSWVSTKGFRVTSEPLAKFGWSIDRSFKTREAAVAALVRFAAKHGVI